MLEEGGLFLLFSYHALVFERRQVGVGGRRRLGAALRQFLVHHVPDNALEDFNVLFALDPGAGALLLIADRHRTHQRHRLLQCADLFLHEMDVFIDASQLDLNALVDAVEPADGTLERIDSALGIADVLGQFLDIALDLTPLFLSPLLPGHGPLLIHDHLFFRRHEADHVARLDCQQRPLADLHGCRPGRRLGDLTHDDLDLGIAQVFARHWMYDGLARRPHHHHLHIHHESCLGALVDRQDVAARLGYEGFAGVAVGCTGQGKRQRQQCGGGQARRATKSSHLPTSVWCERHELTLKSLSKTQQKGDHSSFTLLVQSDRSRISLIKY